MHIVLYNNVKCVALAMCGRIIMLLTLIKFAGWIRSVDYFIFCFTHSKPTANPDEWPAYNVNSKNYLFVDTGLTEIRQNFRPAKMALWNQLLPNLLASFSLIQDGGKSKMADCWTVTALIVVGVVAVSVVVFLVFIVRYIRLKQKLQRVKYLHSLPEKT